MPQPASHFDMAVALLHDSVDRRQTQSGALARCFCSKERLENVCLGPLVHAYSCVGHFQQHEAAGWYTCSSRSGVLIHSHIACLDAQLSPVRQSIARIDYQIQNYLFDLPGVCVYAVERGIQHHCELDVLLDQASDHLLGIGNDLVNVQDHWLKDLLTA